MRRAGRSLLRKSTHVPLTHNAKRAPPPTPCSGEGGGAALSLPPGARTRVLALHIPEIVGGAGLSGLVRHTKGARRSSTKEGGAALSTHHHAPELPSRPSAAPGAGVVPGGRSWVVETYDGEAAAQGGRRGSGGQPTGSPPCPERKVLGHGAPRARPVGDAGTKRGRRVRKRRPVEW